MPGPSSWPCKGRPASSRRVSRAPRPAGRGPGGDDGFPQGDGLVRRERRTRRRPPPCSPCRPPTRARPAMSAAPPRSGRRSATSGRTSAMSARDRGPCTASTARSAVTSVPPMAAQHPGRVGGVGHDVEALLAGPPDDEVVQHRPVLVQQVACTAPFPGLILARSLVSARWSVGRGVGPGQAHRPQVAHVEHGHVRTAGHVLGHRAVRRTRGASPSLRSPPSGPRGPRCQAASGLRRSGSVDARPAPGRALDRRSPGPLASSVTGLSLSRPSRRPSRAALQCRWPLRARPTGRHRRSGAPPSWPGGPRSP